MCIIVCLINALWFCLNEHNLVIILTSIYAERDKNIYSYAFFIGENVVRDSTCYSGIPPGLRRAYLSAPP